MPETAPPSPALTARIIHGALLVAPAFLLVVLWIVLAGRVTVPALRGIAGYTIYAACAVALALGVSWRGRIPPRRPDQSELDYWRVTFPRALLLWALLEGVVMVGALVGFLAGHLAVPLIVLAIYFGIMIFASPGRLAGES